MNRSPIKYPIFFAFILPAALCFFAVFNVRFAGATGGTFTSTKHGGGTVDGIGCPPRCGVDRSVNPDFNLYYYNDPSGEAGKYNPGECGHCHEPHASFGGVEPTPNIAPDSGPENYLLFGDNASALCWYCHESINFDPIYGGGTGVWKFYQGQFNYTGSSHGLSPTFRWPGDDSLVNPSAVWPRDRSAGAALPPVNACINCHTPHGIAGAAYDTGVAPLTTNYTAATTADSTLVDRQTIAREEALCLNCHDGTPAATNIKGEVDSWGFVAPAAWTGATQGSGHPVREITYYGRHDLANESNGKLPSAGWFTAGNKHAECTDCHNPHVARGRGSAAPLVTPWWGNVFQWSMGTNNASNELNPNRYDVATSSSSSAVKAGPVNSGVWGVNVTTATGAVTGAVGSLTTSNRLYQLCLKCHSAWAWSAAAVPNTNAPWNAPTSTRVFTATQAVYNRANLPMTDQAWEFATNRLAYHPVFGQGKNQPEAAGMRNPCWCAGTTCPPVDTTQTAYGAGTCLDGGGTGPNTGTRTDLTGSAVATLSQNFVPPWRHNSYITCVDCHEDDAETTPRGPHGSARPFVLRRLDTGISYPITGMANCDYDVANSCGTGTLSTGDPDNFCLNCHRPDVYGWYAQTSSVIPLLNFPRQGHDTFNGGDAFGGNTPNSMPLGIVCMQCHGGADNRLGTLHGSDYTACQAGCTADATPCIPPTCSTSGRLIVSTGANPGSSEWAVWTKSSVGDSGSCLKGGSPYCAHTSDGLFDRGANYNY